MLDNKLSQDVQDIWRSHKLYWWNHKNFENGTDIRRKKLCCSKGPEKHIPVRCAFTISICNSMIPLKLSKLQEKIKHLMYMDGIKLFSKNKENWKLIHAVRIYCRGIVMEFCIEKCSVIIMKSTERHMRGAMELPNQEKPRTLGETEGSNT